jgi:drug/metabolite transporter (DMT)-like permease
MPYLLLILTTLFWSGNFVLSRGMHEEIPPLALSFWRWSLALLILLPLSWRHLLNQRALIRTCRTYIVMQGLLGITGFNTLIYLAVQTTTAVNAVLVNSCIPVLIALCSLLIYREPLRGRQWLGIFLSLAGVSLIIAGGNLALLVKLQVNRGDLLVLAAAVIWALYSTNLKRYPKGLHPLAYQCAIVIVGLVGILPFYLLEIALGHGLSINQALSATIATLVYVAVFPSVLAFIFWNRAVRDIGANRAGTFIHLMPVFSSILAVLFLGEQIELYHLQGIALVFSGIFMATYRI